MQMVKENYKEEKLASFAKLAKDIPNSEAVCVSQEPRAKKIGDVTVLPWQVALNKYFVE